MLTEKENFMRVIRGEVPAWVPKFGSIPDPFTTKPWPRKIYYAKRHRHEKTRRAGKG
jgi:hypothetical protein